MLRGQILCCVLVTNDNNNAVFKESRGHLADLWARPPGATCFWRAAPPCAAARPPCRCPVRRGPASLSLPHCAQQHCLLWCRSFFCPPTSFESRVALGLPCEKPLWSGSSWCRRWRTCARGASSTATSRTRTSSSPRTSPSSSSTLAPQPTWSGAGCSTPSAGPLSTAHLRSSWGARTYGRGHPRGRPVGMWLPFVPL